MQAAIGAGGMGEVSGPRHHAGTRRRDQDPSRPHSAAIPIDAPGSIARRGFWRRWTIRISPRFTASRKAVASAAWCSSLSRATPSPNGSPKGYSPSGRH